MQPKLPSVSFPSSHWYPSHPTTAPPGRVRTPPTLSTPPPRVWGGLQRSTPNQLQNLPSIWNSDTGRMVSSALGYPSNRHFHPASTQPRGSLPWCSNVTPRPNAYAGVCSVPTPLAQYSPQAPQPAPTNQYPPTPQPAPPNQYPTTLQSSTHTSQAQPYTPAPAASPPSVPQYRSASLGYPTPRLPSGNQTQGPLDPHPASGASSLGMRSSHRPLENHNANTTSVVNVTTDAAAATTLSSTTASNTERALQTVLAGFTDRGQGDMKMAGTLLVNPPLPPSEQVSLDGAVMGRG
ncbi:classical arabinogalactan protein 9 [Salmo salar]|uniref:Classical arabinogalactan protein 9 n=1 Tax=Salmo salar TaxID=8030 RepID=A0ABM3EDX5_SALSA|nr:classical arabinogalactan protein 9-like [Salmo salar]